MGIPDPTPQPTYPVPRDPASAAPDPDPFAQLPTETEIYILPTGEIVVADMPAELASRLTPDSSQPQNPPLPSS